VRVVEVVPVVADVLVVATALVVEVLVLDLEPAPDDELHPAKPAAPMATANRSPHPLRRLAADIAPCPSLLPFTGATSSSCRQRPATRQLTITSDQQSGRGCPPGGEPNPYDRQMFGTLLRGPHSRTVALSRARWVLVAGALVVALAGFGSSASAKTTKEPLPAGPKPSKIATMVCAREAQGDIKEALGVKATVASRTWIDHDYVCSYEYPHGSFTLSVKELSSWPQTLAYFHSLGKKMGVTRKLANLGQGSFQTTDGSVVVRKDWKVLLVNVVGLPPKFGVPPTSSADVAVTVADVILGCWAGD